jgi:mannitol/fructose-specific phosphotransferase system IIA component (Ntr-type)
MKEIIESLTLVNAHKNKIDRLINYENIKLNLKGHSKEAVISELLDILRTNGKLLDHDMAYMDILKREKNKTTGILNGIAIPHAKTTAVQELTIAIGIKKSGLDFDSPLDDKAHILILALAPSDKPKPLYEFLIAITTALNDDDLRSKILTATTPQEIAELLYQYK